MHEFSGWHNTVLGEKVVAALKKNHFEAVYCNERKEAVEHIMALIPEGASVGVGGSWTIKELGLDGLLEQRGNKVLNHNKPGVTPEESLEIRHKQLASDVFISGTNALTLDGRLVNMDGAGNRVAAMIFGPKKVIVIVGVNKIVSDLDAAMGRIELYAAPINNKRLARSNPCVMTGECMDCQGPSRICNVTTILHKKPAVTEFHVVIIGEELGF